MGALDSGLRSAASAAIGAVGATAVLTRVTSCYDPRQGAQTQKEEVWTIKCSPPKTTTRPNGQGVFERGLSCFVAAEGLAVVPNSGTDTLTFGGTKYKVLSVDAQYGGDQVAVYELGLGR